jgi:hypothetical protein
MITLKNNWAVVALFIYFLIFGTSCDRPQNGHRNCFPQISAKAMELYDTNKDGKISGAELDQVPGLKASLAVMGTDKERGITPDHIKALVKKWVDSRIGRMYLSCSVTHNGRPLEGATVIFIPESFLSDILAESATGITDQTGKAIISLSTVPGSDELPPGIPPGIFRIEITKNGEDIPAKYNTKTELGQEVSIDNPEIEKGITFDLQY